MKAMSLEYFSKYFEENELLFNIPEEVRCALAKISVQESVSNIFCHR